MKKYLPLFFLASSLTLSAWADEPWMPYEDDMFVTLGLNYSESDKIFNDSGKRKRLPNEIGDTEVYLNFLYGYDYDDAFGIYLPRRWRETHFDLTRGGLESSHNPIFIARKGHEEEGLGDVKIYWKHLLIDEYDYTYIPTLTLKTEISFPGSDYNVNDFTALGDRDRSLALSLLGGKRFDALSLSAGGGFRWRRGDPANEAFVEAGSSYSITDKIHFHINWEYVNQMHGTPIGAPFDENEEDFHKGTIGVSYDFTPDTSLVFFYQKTLDGKNTDDIDQIGVALTVRFGTKKIRDKLFHAHPANLTTKDGKGTKKK